MLDTVKINHVRHISFTQSRLTDAVSVILNGLLSYEHPPKVRGMQDLFSRLDSARYLTGTQAAGAGVDITGRPVHYRFHSSHVGLPSSVRTTVGVGHLDAKRHALAAASTFCHCTAPPLHK